MQLPEPQAGREPVHTRSIEIRGYHRQDGLWDVEATFTDVKDRDIVLGFGHHPAGVPVHAMQLRITVDDTLLIVAAQAAMEATPHPGTCNVITGHYGQLEGLRIGRGFRKHVMERFGGTAGCAHLTELIMTLATGAVQTLAGLVAQPDDVLPFHLDGCHALDRGGPIVARFYPRWVR